MTKIQRSARSLLLVAFATMLAAACGEKTTKIQVADLPEYHSLKNLPSAPKAIQDAAEAVVRVSTVQGSGTGFFLDATGTMMTNEHVLGSDSCPQSGCFISIARDFQVGKPLRASESVFAKPLYVSKTLDIGVYELRSVNDEGDIGELVATPHHLELKAMPAAELKGQEVYIVGHPAGRLKKWSRGTVMSTTHEWFDYDVFSLGGSSGSPVLTADGRVVGINHRGHEGRAYITGAGYETTATGTMAGPILEALGSPGGLSLDALRAGKSESLKDLVDLAALKRDEWFAHRDQFLAARTLPEKAASEKNASHPMLDAYATACDKALNEPGDDLADDQASKVIGYCMGITSWLSCWDKDDAKAPHKTCPDAKAADRWTERFFKAAETVRNLSMGDHAWNFVTAYTAVRKSHDDQYSARREALDLYLKKYEPELDFELADAIVWYSEGRETLDYRGTDVARYILDFKEQPYYRRDYVVILEGLIDLRQVHEGRFISSGQVVDAILTALRDNRVALGTKLAIETLAYQANLL